MNDLAHVEFSEMPAPPAPPFEPPRSCAHIDLPLAPPPIPYPDAAQLERRRQARLLQDRALERRRLADEQQQRQRAIVQAAFGNGRDTGFREGYREGVRWGLFAGFVSGGVVCGAFGVAVVHLRVWWPTLLGSLL
jgi:hypothetical protein